jgi:hypothetical protein
VGGLPPELPKRVAKARSFMMQVDVLTQKVLMSLGIATFWLLASHTVCVMLAVV